MKRFAPYYQPALWGGRRLETWMHRQLPPGTIGESWELCELPGHHSVVTAGGEEGARLGDLWRSGALGGSAVGAFPFLLKWIDAAADLSVQVHPDAETCQRLQSGMPKSEAWCIADSSKDARLLLGHKPGLTPQSLVAAAENHTLKTFLREVEVAVGDLVFVPAGTIHAIGAGLLLLEVQQPSDTTYRIYDWGRVGADGKPRLLHLPQALEAIHFADTGARKPTPGPISGPGFTMQIVKSQTVLPAQSLRVIVAHSNKAQLATPQGTTTLALGDVVVAEVADQALEVVSGPVIWLTEPQDN